jgi:hypothetical protein
LANFNKERYLQIDADYQAADKNGGILNPDWVNRYIECQTAVNTTRYLCLLQDPVLFEEIKRIEFDATNILLTEEEQEIVDKVSRSPELEGLIAHEGFEMYSERY